MFICLGCKFLDPNYVDDENKLPRTNLIEKEDDKNGSQYRSRGETIKLTEAKAKEKKSTCC